MEMDGYLALFIFVFLFSSVFVFGVYRVSIFTVLFAATIGYLYYLAMNGKITTKELFQMSLIPIGFMLVPLLIITIIFGKPISMLLLQGLTNEMVRTRRF
jgi:hypothetical protein